MTLIGCSLSGGRPLAPLVADLPDEYKEDCVDPVIAAGRRSKQNEISIGAAYGNCKDLKRDQTIWTVCYLMDLGGQQLPIYCSEPRSAPQP